MGFYGEKAHMDWADDLILQVALTCMESTSRIRVCKSQLVISSQILHEVKNEFTHMSVFVLRFTTVICQE